MRYDKRMPTTIAVLAGTTRVQRESIKAARYVAEFGRKLPDVEIIFVDPVDFHFDGDGNGTGDGGILFGCHLCPS